MAFKSSPPIRYESPELLAFEDALSNTRHLIASLHGGTSVPDQTISEIYFALAARMQSNCDAAAEGLLATIGSICVHVPSLAGAFLPSALRPIYYLGVEDFDGIRSYILNVAKQKRPYLETQTQLGSDFLRQIANQKSLIVSAFRQMYDAEDNLWRRDDPNVLSTPSILL